MPLRRRLILLSLGLAIVAAVITDMVVRRVREADRIVFLERLADAYQNDLTRESCETDPRWFLAGPRRGRPSMESRQMVDADVYLPRPSTDPLPLEFFAFDDQFTGSSTAAPRLPDDFKRALRAEGGPRTISGPFDAPEGRGVQTARMTRWTPGPCAVLLFRLRPEPGAGATRAAIFAGSLALSFLVAVLAIVPTAARVRRLATAARASERDNYSAMVPISGNDEISSLGAVFNEAAANIRRRSVDAADREEALQRHVSMASEDVAAPLSSVTQSLGRIDPSHVSSADAAAAWRDAVRQTHQLTTRLENLAVAVRLRTSADRMAREPVDVGALVQGVVDRRQALARASAVTLQTVLPPSTVTFAADPALLAAAIGNVVDNAVLYNRPGGRVVVELKSYERGARFSLHVVDDGPGVSDDDFAGLTANKRFRGDEARTRRAGGRGLGLAVAREAADRLGLQLELRRPSGGGMEVAIVFRQQ